MVATVSTAPATTSTTGGSPAAMRTGMASGAVSGKIDSTRPTVLSGLSAMLRLAMYAARNGRASGAVAAWASSWRDTSEPAVAKPVA